MIIFCNGAFFCSHYKLKIGRDFIHKDYLNVESQNNNDDDDNNIENNNYKITNKNNY